MEALKAANARANKLQIQTNTLEAEKDLLKRELEIARQLQAQEQAERLRGENQNLDKAAVEAATLKTQLEARFAEAKQKLEEQSACRVRELEAGFDQGFKSLQELRNQWLQHKQSLEEQHNRDMVAENLRGEVDRRFLEDQLTAVFKKKEEELQIRETNFAKQMGDSRSSLEDQQTAAFKEKENDLQIREASLTNEMRKFHSSGEDLNNMRCRAEKAEGEILRLQGESKDADRDSIERRLGNEIESQRRDGQRCLDLLNEETSKMAEGSRLLDLHNELQIANCSLNSFKFKLVYADTDTNSETLRQGLYGADFNDSDVQLLRDEGRPVLLAQLKAAKLTLSRLRNILAESLNVEVDRVLSVVLEPRGDEDAAEPGEDIFGPSDEIQQPAPQPNPRKRSEAPLGGPTYGNHEENGASTDWGDFDQDASNGGRLCPPEEVSSRPKSQPKSRRNGRPAISVPPGNLDGGVGKQ